MEFKDSLDQICNYIIQEGHEIITSEDSKITNQQLQRKKKIILQKTLMNLVKNN